MNRWIKAFAAMLATLLLLLVIAVNLPVRLYADSALDAAGIGYTDIHGASLVSGNLWVQHEALDGLARLQYHWCPGLAPLRWCVALKHPDLAFQGRLTLTGLESLRVRDLVIDTLDLAALDLAGNMLGGRISGQVERLDWVAGDCPMADIGRLQGRLTSDNLSVLGTAAGGHELVLASANGILNAQIDGQTFRGSLEAQGANYTASGELTAPESMLSMARNLMRPLGGNRFAWEISGSLPC